MLKLAILLLLYVLYEPTAPTTIIPENDHNVVFENTPYCVVFKLVNSFSRVTEMLTSLDNAML